MRRGRAIHRVDGTAKELIAAAKQFGAQYAAADGTFDGVLWMPSTGRIELIDWKGARGELTASQAKLVAQGWPLRFIGTVDQLQGLVSGDRHRTRQADPVERSGR
jgi:hypothetical protein